MRAPCACVDICHPIVSVEEKHSQDKSLNFSVLLFYMGGNQTRFLESSDSDIKKLVANAVPENMNQKHRVFEFLI